MSNYSTREHRCEECDGIFTGRKKKYCSDDCHREVRNRRRRETKNVKEKTTLKCEWCNEEYQVLKRYAYQSQYCSEECGQERYSREVRGHGPAEEDRLRRKKQKEQTLARLELERSRKQLRNSLNKVIKYKEEQERIKELTRPCEECGEVFYDPHPHTLTCSSECSKKRKNRWSRLYNSTRLNETNIIDRDITLEKLYKRDDGICYLCGGECDYYDHTITLEGHYIAGPTHPSIEHVIAIANKGMHSWENVKLAHFRCNTLKSDTKLEEYTKASV